MKAVNTARRWHTTASHNFSAKSYNAQGRTNVGIVMGRARGGSGDRGPTRGYKTAVNHPVRVGAIYGGLQGAMIGSAAAHGAHQNSSFHVFTHVVTGAALGAGSGAALGKYSAKRGAISKQRKLNQTYKGKPAPLKSYKTGHINKAGRTA